MKATVAAFALALAVPAGAQTVPPAPADGGAVLVGMVPPAPVDLVAELMAGYRNKTAFGRPCPTGPSGEIVVCGRRSPAESPRLPLPEEAQDPEGSHIVRGELPRASAKPIKQGSCGVVRETKPCNRGLEIVKMHF